MSTETGTQPPPIKRGRTAASEREYQSPSEELSQVANLVERRRVQNRISQRNYRNKIRSRLEKLEALVESNKAAQKEAAAALNGSTPAGTPAAGETSTVRPRVLSDPTLPATDSYSQPEAARLSRPSSLSFCKCMLEPASFLNISGNELMPMCHCGQQAKDMNAQSSGQGLDSMTPVSQYMDTDSGEQLYGLPSPGPLQCHTPATLHPADMSSMSMGSNMGIDHSHPHSGTSTPGEPMNLLNADSPPSGQYQHFHKHSGFQDRMAYPFPAASMPMATAMVPMAYMAIPTTHGAADFNLSDGTARGHTPWAGHAPPGSATSPHATPFMWVPASMMMVPMAAPLSHHHANMGAAQSSDNS